MYTFDKYFSLEITKHLHNKTVDNCVHQLVLHILCELFVQ